MATQNLKLVNLGSADEASALLEVVSDNEANKKESSATYTNDLESEESLSHIPSTSVPIEDDKIVIEIDEKTCNTNIADDDDTTSTGSALIENSKKSPSKLKDIDKKSTVQKNALSKIQDLPQVQEISETCNLPTTSISKEGKSVTIVDFAETWDEVYEDHNEHPFHKLCFVIRNGDTNQFKLMQEENEYICAVRDKSGDSILHLASKYGQFEMCKILVRYLNVNTKKLWTPLHYAAARGYNEIVQLFLERNADINAEDENGQTPLHVAAKHGRLQAVKLLLDWGTGNHVIDGGNMLQWMARKLILNFERFKKKDFYF